MAERLAGKALTGRELTVLRRVAQGAGDEAIAAWLVVSVPTVKSYVRRILAKLGADGRAHAVARGFETGLLAVPLPAPVAAVLSAARPLLLAIPRCPWHPTIASLPDACGDCRRWVAAQGVVAELDAVLGGGAP